MLDIYHCNAKMLSKPLSTVITYIFELTFMETIGDDELHIFIRVKTIWSLLNVSLVVNSTSNIDECQRVKSTFHVLLIRRLPKKCLIKMNLDLKMKISHTYVLLNMAQSRLMRITNPPLFSLRFP